MFELEKSTVFFRDSFVPFSRATLHVASAPVLYGLSVYTVFPVLWNHRTKKLYAFRLEDHFQRLMNSAKIMGFHTFAEDWSFERFRAVMLELLARNDIQEDTLVRVSVFVDGMLTGTRMQGLNHQLAAFIYPAVPLLPRAGAHLCVSSWQRTPDNAIPSRAKINGSYVNASLMKQEALTNGYDDAIALDGAGHVTESSVANIFIIRNGTLVTPADASDLLEGITRDSVIKIADSLRIPHLKRNVDRSELYLADEIFLCGSSMRLVPVLSVDRRPIGTGKPGPVTETLSRRYEAGGRGNGHMFADWRTAVPMDAPALV